MRFQNRLHRFVRNILQNSRLNKEKFVIYKRLYNNQKVTYIMIKRKFGTYTSPSNQDQKPPSNIWLIIIAGFITGICIDRNN